MHTLRAAMFVLEDGNLSLSSNEAPVVRTVACKVDPCAILGDPCENVDVAREVARRVDDEERAVAVVIESSGEWAYRCPV